jgi:hypothetical protein
VLTCDLNGEFDGAIGEGLLGDRMAAAAGSWTARPVIIPL